MKFGNCFLWSIGCLIHFDEKYLNFEKYYSFNKELILLLLIFVAFSFKLR